MPKPIATWNPARGVWETDRVNLLCGHSEPYSQTWLSSGTTRGGVAYELPTWVPRMDDSESSSLLPTPRAQNGEPRNQTLWIRPLDEPQNLENALALLPTPRTSDTNGPGAHGDGGMDLRTAVSVLLGGTDKPSGDGNPS